MSFGDGVALGMFGEVLGSLCSGFLLHLETHPMDDFM